MIDKDALKARVALLRERLLSVRHIPALERVRTHIHSLSPGDRVLFYLGAGLVSIVSVVSLYSLEQSLLVEGELGSPQFINPLLAISDADRDLSTLVYAGLMGLSSSGELVPVLTES